MLRGIEFYQHHLVDYSLGNFANYHDFVSGGTTSLSGILRVTVGADGSVAKAGFTSVRLSSTGQATIDATNAAADLVNQVSAADFGPAAGVIQPDGSITAPAS